jgi:3-hydroxyacyl-CoA dehydrogenase
MKELVRIATEGGVATITIDNPPVNALGPGVPEGLRARVREARADSDARAVVIIGAGATFPAGADIRELEDVARGRAPKGGPAIHDLLAEIEDSPKPVVMAIHGTALGGGLELAMAGHYRVAAPGARLGQPEVTLGIIPGAEGSQRLPRLVGIRTSLDMCVSGRPLDAEEALRAGLVDHLVPGDLAEGAAAFAREAAAGGTPPPKTREREEKLGSPEENAPLFAAARREAARLWRGMSAPLRAIEAIEAAATLGFEDGCRREREIAAECLNTDECRALIHAFFAERAVRQVRGLGPDLSVPAIRRAVVIGAGTMGSGIATALVNAGIEVTLTDTDRTRTDPGLEAIRRNLERSVERGRLTREDMAQRLARVEGRPASATASAEAGYPGVADADLIVEAVFEDMDLKREVFRAIDRTAPAGAILASNTSTLDIDQIAGATGRPERVIGLHFFNPAHVMRLLEIVRGPRTGPSAVAASLEIARKLRKVGVVVGNCRGFVGNRMMLPYMREAQYLVEEGASPAQVDQALYEFGMAMGIFAVDDMGGLDLQWKVRQEEMRLGLAAPRPLGVLPRLCEMGRLGQKTGRGWYRYEPGDRTPVPDPEVDALIESVSREAGIERRDITPGEIVERSVCIMINEGARILEEGHAQRASDIDTIYLTGYGFPRWRGGPMWYADTVGPGKVLERTEHYRTIHGEVWAPAPLLRRLADEGRLFRDLDDEAQANRR